MGRDRERPGSAGRLGSAVELPLKASRSSRPAAAVRRGAAGRAV